MQFEGHATRHPYLAGDFPSSILREIVDFQFFFEHLERVFSHLCFFFWFLIVQLLIQFTSTLLSNNTALEKSTSVSGDRHSNGILTETAWLSVPPRWNRDVVASWMESFASDLVNVRLERDRFRETFHSFELNLPCSRFLRQGQFRGGIITIRCTCTVLWLTTRSSGQNRSVAFGFDWFFALKQRMNLLFDLDDWETN